MVNCRSEERKTFDVKLLWTFDSVSLADTPRSRWSLNTTMFSISLFSLNLRRIPFEKKTFWNGAASFSHLNTTVVISELRRWEKKNNGNVAFIGWKLFPQSRMIQNHQRCLSHTGVMKFLQHCGVCVFFFLLIFLYMWEIWFYPSSLASEDDSHLSWSNFLVSVELFFITQNLICQDYLLLKILNSQITPDISMWLLEHQKQGLDQGCSIRRR